MVEPEESKSTRNTRLLRTLDFKAIRWAWHLPHEIWRDNMIVQATDGCSYDRCGFCYSYKPDYPSFRIVPLEEVRKDFEETYALFVRFDPTYANGRKTFVGDANPLVRPADEFLEILGFLHGFGPIKDTLDTIGTYARADTLLQREAYLERLRKAGLTDINIGVESGDDEILKSVNKGYTTGEIREAARALKAFGYRTHLFVISGLGGRERTISHAAKTAALLNELNPDTIVISPLTLSAETPLGQRYLRGEFEDLPLDEKIAEEARLIAGINSPTAIKLMGCFRCGDIGIEGKLPDDKDKILKWLRKSAQDSQHYKSCAPEPVGAGISPEERFD